MAKRKRTENYLQNITQTTKDRATRNTLKTPEQFQHQIGNSFVKIDTTNTNIHAYSHQM